MLEVIVRAQEGCDPDPFLLPDTIWLQADGIADFRLAGADEKLNRGGLAAHRALETAVMLALFTDRRMPDDHPLRWLADCDPRGWWGDAVDVRSDLGETALGSLLWIFERAPLTIDRQPATMWAERVAYDALQPLLDQGMVVRVDVQATASELQNRMDLAVQLYGRDAQRIYDRKFELVWNQLSS